MTIRDLLERELGVKFVDQGDEQSIRCFHHPDTHNSCSLNVVSGVWFCHSTGAGGNLVSAIMHIRKCERDEAKKVIRDAGHDPDEKVEKPGPPPETEAINPGIRDAYEKALWADHARLEKLHEFGWSDDTIRRFGIGFNSSTSRYAIPVYRTNGELANFRMYDPDKRGEDKTISWKKGYGRARLYPFDLLEGANDIILAEGEKDSITMNQVLADEGVEGWACVTGTGGAGTWRAAWNDSFTGKRVWIVYDNDKAGHDASFKIAKELLSVADQVAVVKLDIEEPPGADLTDYFALSGKSWEDLKRLIDAAETFGAGVQRTREPRVIDTSVHSPHLSLASQGEYLNRRISLEVVVAGKDLAPYAVPKRLELDCQMNNGTSCISCAMNANGGVMNLEIDGEDPDLIKMVRVTQETRDAVLRAKHGVNTKCRKVDQRVTEWHNIEEITIVPEIERRGSGDNQETEYVTRTGYALEHGVQTNRSYIAVGTSVPHPRTQHVVHFFHGMKETQDTVSQFALDDEAKEQLKIFRRSGDQTVADKMNEISRDLELNVTHIYGRGDIIRGVDLCFHTVVAFDFHGMPVAKAWGDILLIGDTRTGKSETVERMIEHYRMGEMSLGETTSFAGLVGGLRQEAGGRWNLIWGRIPLNDRKLLAIDETSGLDLEAISTMSGIRSNGVAELTKIVTNRTTARTRLIWISNPRSTKTMSQHAHGVEALKDLIGRPEDIARFDYAIAAATSEVPITEINAIKHDAVAHRYTGDLCNLLIRWVWSRTGDQVKFEDGCTERILELATEQSGRYTSDGGIPLVEGGNHRIKIAKLAVAVAAREFSTDDSYEVIVVKIEHAEYAAQFLDEAYAKNSLDYLGWSEAAIAQRTVTPEVRAEVEEWIAEHSEWANMFLRNQSVRLEDVRTMFDLETNEARANIFKPLIKCQMLIRQVRGSGYEKTPGFIQLLKEMKNQAAGVNGHPHPAAQVQVPVAAQVASSDQLDSTEEFPF